MIVGLRSIIGDVMVVLRGILVGLRGAIDLDNSRSEGVVTLRGILVGLRCIIGGLRYTSRSEG